MKILLMPAMLLGFISCGNQNNTSGECRTRESMQLQCQAENTPRYGWTFTQELCARTYPRVRCY